MIGKLNAGGLAGPLEGRIGMIESEPVTTAVRVETRDIESPLVQQPPIASLRPIAVAADVLVDIFVL